MSEYKTVPAECRKVFSDAERHASTASAKRTRISGDVDEVRGACSQGEAARIASALSAVYNRVLGRASQGAVQQIRSAVAGGRAALGAIEAGTNEMVEQFEIDAHIVDDIRLMDGKPL